MTRPLTRRRLLHAAVASGPSLGFPAATRAQAWPSQPIRLVVGQTVYVENKPGAGGNIAMAEVAHADG